jgi:hypothetical protein
MESVENDRVYWIETMCRIGKPVLEALAARQLKAPNDRERI